MKKSHKYSYIAIIILLSGLYVILNLYKGVAVRGGNPFSLYNVVKVCLVFVVGVPIAISIRRLLKRDKKD